MKNYKVSVMLLLIIKYQHNLCRPQGSWQEDGRLGEEGFDQQGEMPTISRDSKLAFYSVLWKQHVYIAQVEVIDAALQMA